MNAQFARLVVYLAGLGASLLALAGYATYDTATGTLDILPFNVPTVATWIVTAISNALAAVANIRGWGKK